MDRIDDFNKMLEQMDHSDPVQVQGMIDLINRWLNEGTDSTEFQSAMTSLRTHLLLDAWGFTHDIKSLNSAMEQLEITINIGCVIRNDVNSIERIFNILLKRWQEKREVQVLTQSISWGNNYHHFASNKSPSFFPNLINLADALSESFSINHDLQDLNRCVDLYEQALACNPEQGVVRARCLYNLQSALRTRCDWETRPTDLDRRIELCEEGLKFEQDPSKCDQFANNLGFAYWCRYEKSNLPEVLERSIHNLERVLTFHTDISRINAVWLEKVSKIFFERFKINGCESDFDNSIKLMTAAIQNTIDEETTAWHTYTLGRFYYKRYEVDKNEEHLEHALQSFHEASSKSAKLMRNASFLNDHGCALHSQFLIRKNISDLELCIYFFEKGLECSQKFSKIYLLICQNLAWRYYELFSFHFDVHDLERSIELYWTGIQNQSQIESKIDLINNLQRVYDAKYQHQWHLKDLKNRIQLLHWHTRLLGENFTQYVDNIILLSNAYGLCLGRTGNPKYFSLAIDVALKALDRTSEPVLEKKLFESIADRFFQWYLVSGDLDDLNKSIELLEIALQDAAESDISALDKLSIRLAQRSVQNQCGEDYDRAWAIQESLSQIIDFDDISRRAFGVNRAIIQFYNFFLKMDFSSLKPISETLRKLLLTFPRSEKDRFNRNTCQFYLALVLYINSTFDKYFNDDGDESIILLKELVKERPDYLPNSICVHFLLGTLLLSRFDFSGDESDYYLGKEIVSTALELVPKDSYQWANIYALFEYQMLQIGREDPSNPEERFEKITILRNSSDKLGNSIVSFVIQIITAELLFAEYKSGGNQNNLNQAITILESTTDTNSFVFDWASITLAGILWENSKIVGQYPDWNRIINILLPVSDNPRGFDYLKAFANRILGETYLQLNQIKDAQISFERMASNLEQIRARTHRRRERDEVFEDYAHGFASLVFCCMKLDQPEKALRYAEAAKSRALVDALYNQVTDFSKFATQDETLKGNLEEWQILKKEINWLLKQLDAGDESMGWIDPNMTRFNRPLDKINAELKGKQEKEKDLWEAIEKQAPVFALTVSAPAFYSEDALALAAKEQAALISYFEHRDGWIAFLVERENLHCVELTGVTKLLEYYQSAFSNLRSPFGKSLLNSVLEEAWQVLIKPLEAWLPAEDSNLVIAPFAGLHYLPFAAFTNPEDGSCLIDHYRLKAATSLGTLKAMHAQSLIPSENHAKPHTMTVVGYADNPSSSSYLPAVETEVNAISSLFHLPQPLIGQDANIENVLNQAPGSQSLHLACHGMFDPRQPQLSGLMLEDGWLTVRDVMTRMNLSGTDMVVMSACLSGLSKISQGEELTGLLTAFIAARAKVVVGSLWSVDDSSTAALMVRFYELIRDGLEKSSALRQAQLEIREQPQWSHPYYWSPFFLTGVE